MNTTPQVPAARGGGQPGNTDKPALSELVRQLKLAYRQAGNPSYRSLTRTTGIGVSTSTISRIFNARTPPKWENLTELLLAIGVTREEIKTTWHRLWSLAVNEANPLTGTDSAAGELLPAGRRPKEVEICLRCGAWVGDRELHVRWHGKLARPEAAPIDGATPVIRRRRH